MGVSFLGLHGQDGLWNKALDVTGTHPCFSYPVQSFIFNSLIWNFQSIVFKGVKVEIIGILNAEV